MTSKEKKVALVVAILALLIWLLLRGIIKGEATSTIEYLPANIPPSIPYDLTTMLPALPTGWQWVLVGDNWVAMRKGLASAQAHTIQQWATMPADIVDAQENSA